VLYRAQFLRYLDQNFMEGVFQYYLEVLFLFKKKLKKRKKISKKPLKKLKNPFKKCSF